jgi:hypothetical protein
MLHNIYQTHIFFFENGVKSCDNDDRYTSIQKMCFVHPCVISFLYKTTK